MNGACMSFPIAKLLIIQPATIGANSYTRIIEHAFKIVAFWFTWI